MSLLNRRLRRGVVVGLAFALVSGSTVAGASAAPLPTAAVAAATRAAATSAPATLSPDANSAPDEEAGVCDSNPLANVRRPSRMEVRGRCVTVHGVVSRVGRAPDGDVKFRLKLDDGQGIQLTARNKGTLVMEIVPADQPGCTKGQKVRDGFVCSGRAVPTPQNGAHIAATGTLVLEKESEGWIELHPIWRIVTE